MQIGAYALENPVVLAPMAGVADVAFRSVCLSCGAGLAVGEMVASNQLLRKTAKTERRYRVSSAEKIPVIQILGADPGCMADAASYAESCGAKIVDVNFGCPARVVCGKACGSALMADVPLAVRVLQAVRNAVSVPVTVKMRTGWDAEHKTVLELAKAAEEIGFSAVTVHGRTREQRFSGQVDYETIAEVASLISIPVIANGDIDSGAKALRVMKETGASGVMIGRAAWGAPWIFREIADVLARREARAVTLEEKRRIILAHWQAHVSEFRSEPEAVRSFRKHVLHYLNPFPEGKVAAQRIFKLDKADLVRRALEEFFQERLWTA